MRFVLVLSVCVLFAWGCSSEKAEVPEESAAPAETQEPETALVEFDTPPEPVEEVAPEYPAAAKQAGATGTAHVEVIVDETGKVTETRIAQSSTHEMLDEAAKLAASQWVFKPAMLDEKPVSAKIIIPFEFELH
jgi:protein TonB